MLSLSFWEESMPKVMSEFFRRRGWFSGLEEREACRFRDVFLGHTWSPTPDMNKPHPHVSPHRGYTKSLVMSRICHVHVLIHNGETQARPCVSVCGFWLGWREEWRVLRAGPSIKGNTSGPSLGCSNPDTIHPSPAHFFFYPHLRHA